MAINRVEIKDFLVFRGNFSLDFCCGINVIIGGNGTGKTTLLKAMYMLCDSAKKRQRSIQRTSESSVSEPNQDDIQSKVYEVIKITPYFLDAFFPRGVMIDVRSGSGAPAYQREPQQPKIQPQIKPGLSEAELIVYGFDVASEVVFIPYTDVLSHSRGFLSLYDKRDISFDETYADLLLKAQLPVTRKISPVASAVMNTVKSVIGGEVICENDVFFMVRDDGVKIPFTLEASGYRKLGLIWKLLRNGILEPGSILYWDEPENSLNPELIPVLVDILLELSRNGVQVFIATHSELLASYFAVNSNSADEVLFTALYKDGEQIKANTGKRFDLLEPNNLLSEPVKLYEKELEKGLGGNG